MHPFITIATRAARCAGRTIVSALDRLDQIKISEKEHNDFVTEIDKKAEMQIIDTIKRAYPHHAILGEESGFSAGTQDYCWIIDPLDGTSNFIHGIPHFAVSIAVKKGNDILAGVIFDPVKNELFTAARGEGARLDQRRIRVNATRKLSDALLATGFPFRKKELLPPFLKTFEAIFSKCSGMRRAGAAALDLAYTAAGRLDGFWEASLGLWDIAAGVLLVQEAGGICTDFKGSTDYLSGKGPINLIAGTFDIHQALLTIIQESFTLSNN
jgi:myo-inositol-1(or 4)-monophosphatase